MKGTFFGMSESGETSEVAETATRVPYDSTAIYQMLRIMMSFIVLSETKPSIPPYTLWGTFHHEKEIKHI